MIKNLRYLCTFLLLWVAGVGLAQDVVEISTVDQLVVFRNQVNGGNNYAGKTVALKADLDMSSVGNWVPIGIGGGTEKSFCGTFNGNNHTISNLKSNYKDFAGLFGTLYGYVKNLKMVNVNVTSTHYAGGIAAHLGSENGKEISDCSVSGGTIKSTPELVNGSYDNGDKVGGILGYIAGIDKVSNCIVENVTIQGYRDLGGIVGIANGKSTVSGCTATGITIIQDNLNGYKSYDEVKDMVGGIAGRVAKDATITTDNSSSNVTIEHTNFLQISSVDDIIAFRDEVNAGKNYVGITVELTADLDMTSVENWIPIGNGGGTDNSFCGTFDGKNHTISNLKSNNKDQAGLFGTLYGYVKNLKMENVNITSTHYAGGIAAHLGSENGKVISNCHVSGGTITSTPELVNGSYDNGDKAGGILGYVAGIDKVTNCTATNLTIQGYRDLGGIVGIANGNSTVSGCTATGITIIQDNEHGYKSYSDVKDLAQAIAGRVASGATVTDNNSSDITIKHINFGVAKIGEVEYETLQSAIDAAETGATINILKDYTLTTVTTSPNEKYNVNVNKSVTINGDGHTITSSEGKRALALTGDGNNITLKNLTVVNNKSDWCVGILNNPTVTLDATTIDGSGYKGEYNQPLTIGGSGAGGVKLNVTNGSVIKTNDEGTAHYSIIAWRPAEITVTDSELTGWAAIYFKPAATGSTATVENSTLTSKNPYSGNSNQFGVFSIEATNVTVDVTNSTIDIDGVSNKQAIVNYGTTYGDCTGSMVNLGEGNKVTLKNQATFTFNQGDTYKLQVSGGLFSEQVPEENCAEGIIPTANTDEATSATYPYTVKEGSYVAQIEGGAKYESLKDAVAAAGSEETVITLLKDVKEGVVVKDGKNIVLNLGGKTLTGGIDQYDSQLTIENGTLAGTVYVNGGPASAEAGYNKFTLAADAAITADWGFILYQGPNGNDAYGSVIDINGTVNGTAWVMGNITEGNSVINVNNGAKIQGKVFGLNGLATLNVKEGATIIGSETGIEVRAGNLNVEGGKITSTATEYTVKSEGSGTTTTGAAIAVAQHTTKLPISTNITGCTLTGVKTISVADPENGNLAGVTVKVADALANVETVVIPEGYKWVSSEGMSTLTPCDYVAQIGEQKYESLKDAVAAAGSEETVITLLKDVKEGVVVKDGKNIVLNLGGKTLTGGIDQYDSQLTIENGTLAGTVYVNGGPASAEAGYNKFTLAADAAITADWGFILYQGPNGNDAYGSVIDINGTVNGTAWVMGNITEGNSVINVNNGAKIQGKVFGLNGLATLNVKEGATIIGSETGIEVRAGNLNVEGGKITSTATEYTVKSEGSGTTTTGAAIAVAQHTTMLATEVKISGGEFVGIKSLSIANPEGNAEQNVTVAVSGGKFNGDIEVSDTRVSKFISGGVFTDDVEMYCAEGFVCVDNDDATYKYTVKTNEEAGIFELHDTDVEYPYPDGIAATKVTYIRSFTQNHVNNKYLAWYVPFDYRVTDKDDDFQFYKINMIAAASEAGVVGDVENIYVFIQEVGKNEVLRANRPYVIQPKKALTDYEFVAEDIDKLYPVDNSSRLQEKTTNFQYDFYGNYEVNTFKPNEIYAMFGGGIALAKGTNPLGTYRWYIQTKPREENIDYAKPNIFIVEGDGDTDSINNAQTEECEIQGIYTLGGIKVEHPVKGVNIIKYTDGRTKKINVK